MTQVPWPAGTVALALMLGGAGAAAETFYPTLAPPGYPPVALPGGAPLRADVPRTIRGRPDLEVYLPARRTRSGDPGFRPSARGFRSAPETVFGTYAHRRALEGHPLGAATPRAAPEALAKAAPGMSRADRAAPVGARGETARAPIERLGRDDILNPEALDHYRANRRLYARFRLREVKVDGQSKFVVVLIPR